MTIRTLLLTLLLVISAPPVTAQQVAWDYVGGGFGGSDFHVRDGHASPLIFGAWGIAPVLQYIHAGDGNRQYFEASYYSSSLTSPADNFRTDTWGGRGRYAYMQSVAEIAGPDRPLRVFLGGALNSYLNRAHYYYYVPPLGGYSSSIDSWYWSHSLDLALQAEWGIADREFLLLQCYMPVLSNVSRPQYSPGGDYSYTENVWKMKVFGRTEVFPKNSSIDLLLVFQVPVVWKFNFQASYEFYFASYDLPREMKLYMNNARGGVFFCF